MSEYILEVSNATKKFGGLMANEDITFKVRKGEIVGIVGPNGAGKTTLFNSISGAHKLTSGSIKFNGIEITNMKANQICRLGVGRTFQIPQSLNEMTVKENVLIGTLCRHPNMEEAKAKCDKYITLCGLEKFSNEKVGMMNVIQKKRVEIARALATEPILLLLDETMAGLTNTERKEAVQLIKQINGMGITILTIEHVMDVVMAVSNRVVVIHSGKLLVEGTPEEVTRDEKVINAYLGGTENDVRS